MRKKKSDNPVVKIILFFIAVTPLIYLNQVENVSIKVFILGTGSWGFGLIIKMILHQVVIVPLHNKQKSILIESYANGLLSGVCELLAAYVLIQFTKDKFIFDLNAIIGFGLAIGSLETILVVFQKGSELLKGTALADAAKKSDEFTDNLKSTSHFILNNMLPILDRILASLIHISTRGLVFITIITNDILPILFALIIFFVADGVLGYYYIATDRFSNLEGYRRFYVRFLLLSLISVILFVIYISPLPNVML